GRVARPAGFDRRHPRRGHVPGRALVGLAHAEVVDDDAPALERGGPGRHGDGGRDLEAQDPTGQLCHTASPVARPTRVRYLSRSRRSTTGGTRSVTRPPSWNTSLTSRDDT